MGVPTPEDRARGYEIPFVLRETVEFDVAADLGVGGALPVGEFASYEVLHPPVEFDCSQPAEKEEGVAVRLMFHEPAGEASPSLSRDVSELLYALNKELGGRELGSDLEADAIRRVLALFRQRHPNLRLSAEVLDVTRQAAPPLSHERGREE